MLIDLKITLDYNPETGELVLVNNNTKKKKIVKEKPLTEQVNEIDYPILKLDIGRYYLNNAAVALFEPDITGELRIDIKYKTTNGIQYPVIGTSSAFGTQSGNKLSKTHTVCCRGKAFDLLSTYGNEFRLVPIENTKLFMLVNNEIDKPTENIIEEKEEDIIIPSFSENDEDNILDIDLINFKI
jgi:hypothetical protein